MGYAVLWTCFLCFGFVLFRGNAYFCDTMIWLQDFLNYIEGDKGYSKETVETYRRDLLRFHTFFTCLDAEMTWATVDADVVRGWMMERMQPGLNPRTMRKALTALRSFYRYMLMLGRIEADPMQRVQYPKYKKPLPSYVKSQEMDSLLDDVKFADDFSGRQEYLIILLLYSTGIRLSELVGLSWRDVNFVDGEIKVTGKRNKQRIIPFGEELRAELEKFKEISSFVNGEDAIFVDKRGRRIKNARVREIVKNCLSVVTTQKKKTPHVLRHTFATAMLNNGAELEAVRQLLGHESLATTEIYTHTTFAELKNEYELAHPRA